MAKQKPLVYRHLENISGDVLSRYRNVIRDYVKGQHGVYALYQKNRLQYVGLASNLRSRLGHHLKDRHAGTWDSFSVYLTLTDEHLRELESLVLRIAAPKGNKLAGQFFNSEDLRPRFRRQISEFHKLELARMLGLTTPKQVEKLAVRVKSNGRIPTLAKHVRRPFTIRMSYKGKLYKAQVKRDGTIYHRGKSYTSPSSAASAITRRPMDGWLTWKYRRAPNDWVPLDELRR
jgi:hypothetical protein